MVTLQQLCVCVPPVAVAGTRQQWRWRARAAAEAQKRQREIVQRRVAAAHLREADDVLPAEEAEVSVGHRCDRPIIYPMRIGRALRH